MRRERTTATPGPGPSRRAVVGGAALAAFAATGAGQSAAHAASGSPEDPWQPVPVPEQLPVTEYQIPVSGSGSLWCWDTGGSGQPVVLLHPGSGSGESWHPFGDMPVDFKELGPSYRGGDRDGVAAWLAINARARTADAFAQSLAHEITWAALETLTLPVQLVTGDADLYSPPSVMRLNAAHVSGSETHVVREAGHNPHWEQPAAWNRLLVRFMKRHSR